MDSKDWNQRQHFPSLQYISYRIIIMLQEFHILLSTQQHRILSFNFQTPRAYCTYRYQVLIAYNFFTKFLWWQVNMKICVGNTHNHDISSLICIDFYRFKHFPPVMPWDLKYISLTTTLYFFSPLNTILNSISFVVLFSSILIISSWDLLLSCGFKYSIYIYSKQVYL